MIGNCQSLSTVGVRPERRPATQAEAAALSSDLRLRMIRMTFDRPLTNKELAERLGKDPATTLHHVRKLVATGFLEAMPVRAGNRGAKEIPYRSTDCRGSSTTAKTRSPSAKRCCTLSSARSPTSGSRTWIMSRLVVTVDPEELKQRLASLMNELAAQPVRPDVPRVAIYLAVYPGD